MVARQDALLAQMRRGTLQYCVLSLLADEERYGFDLVRGLAEMDGMVTSEGTIYPLLSRLRRDGLVAIIKQEADMDVVAETGDGQEAAELWKKHRPDITLMDLRMPGMDGVNAIYQIRAADPNARFLICGDFNDTIDSEPLRTLVGTGPGALQPFFSDIPEAERETYNTTPYESMIDFIFASPAMAQHFESGSYRILHGTIESSGSDHNPVSARFRVRG